MKTTSSVMYDGKRRRDERNKKACLRGQVIQSDLLTWTSPAAVELSLIMMDDVKRWMTAVHSPVYELSSVVTDA